MRALYTRAHVTHRLLTGKEGGREGEEEEGGERRDGGPEVGAINDISGSLVSARR